MPDMLSTSALVSDTVTGIGLMVLHPFAVVAQFPRGPNQICLVRSDYFFGSFKWAETAQNETTDEHR